MSHPTDEHQTVFKEADETLPQPPNQEMSSSSPKKTSTGLDENVAGLLCYLLGLITGVLFLILEKENRFVRFHAFQSIFTVIFLFVVNMVLSVIPVIGWIIGLLMAPLCVCLWLFLMYKAYKGVTYKLPIIGNIAEKQVNSVK